MMKIGFFFFIYNFIGKILFNHTVILNLRCFLHSFLIMIVKMMKAVYLPMFLIFKSFKSISMREI